MTKLVSLFKNYTIGIALAIGGGVGVVILALMQYAMVLIFAS